MFEVTEQTIFKPQFIESQTFSYRYKQGKSFIYQKLEHFKIFYRREKEFFKDLKKI